MLYSDSTLLSRSGTKSGWPIVMSIANIPLEQRKKCGGYKMMGLLPHLPKEMESKSKIEVFNRCLEHVLGPLKRLSYSGIDYKGVKLFPFLYAYIHDYPEGCKVKNIINCFLSLYNYSFFYYI